jgi:replication factor C subunit 3/5
MALLREIYGPGVLKLKVEHRSFKGTSSKPLELMTVSSMYHIEMNPADAGNQDRVVVQEVIKEIAQSPPIDYSSQKGFKVVVLSEVDKLSRDAQHALRRTMEKYITSFRLVMCCNSTSKVLEPVRSRCLAIRVAAPSEEDVRSVLISIAKKEGFAVPDELTKKIAEMAKGNLRRAILTLEAMKVRQQPLTTTAKVDLPDWEEFIAKLANEIVSEQNPRVLQQVRGKLYELLTHCIPPELILKKLTLELLKLSEAEIRYETIKWAAFYEHRLQLGTKPIFHLEAFVAKFMSIYKRWKTTWDDIF